MVCPLRLSLFFFNDTATTEIYTLSLHDALPISARGELQGVGAGVVVGLAVDDHLGAEAAAVADLDQRRPLRHHHRRSEEHTSELQSPDHLVCRLLLEKKKIPYIHIRSSATCCSL